MNNTLAHLLQGIGVYALVAALVIWRLFSR